MVNLFSAKTYLSNYGIKSKWAGFIVLLFFFGFLKHRIGYYTSLDSSYCRQTGICGELAKRTHATYFEKLEALVGAETTVWLESVGEGLTYVLVGVPFFLFVRPQLLAAFATGIVAHVISDYSGIHTYFCRTSCSVNPL
jgi:hypothetical protein